MVDLQLHLLPIWLVCSFIFFYALHYGIRIVLWKRFQSLSLVQVHLIATKLVSALQAIVVVCVSTRTMLVCTDIMYGTDPVLETYILAASAYFIYDVVVMHDGYVMSKQITGGFSKGIVSFLRADTLIVCHHAVLQFVLLPIILFWRRNMGAYFIAGFFFAEISTPFYSMRNILKISGHHEKTLLYSVNGVLFAAAFFIGRVSTIPFLYYRYAVYREITFLSVPLNIPLHCNFFCFVFELLQCYWFYLIVRSVIYYCVFKGEFRVARIDSDENKKI